MVKPIHTTMPQGRLWPSQSQTREDIHMKQSKRWKMKVRVVDRSMLGFVEVAVWTTSKVELMIWM